MPSGAGAAGAAGEEDQLELADLELVAVLDLGVVDALAVEVRAVERPDVADSVARPGPHDLRVAARHRDVVEEDVAVRMAAGAGDDAVEEELRPRVRAALDDEHPDALGEVVEGDGELVLRPLARRVDGLEERDRGLVALRLRERRAARGAEVGAGRVPVPALVAEHVARVLPGPRRR
jgi:hypothetical protein